MAETKYSELFEMVILQTQFFFMKRIIIPFCVATLFFSCKKNDPVNVSGVRVLKINYKDSSGVPGSTTVFDYDLQGRITKVASTYNSSTSTLAEITYSGSDIIITPVLGLPIVSEIRYTVDAAGNPLTRIQSTITTFNAPNPPQYEYKTDTSGYEYDGSGLLVKKTTTSFDSLWFKPDANEIDIAINTGKSTAIYTNTDNMLAQIDITGYDSSRNTFGNNRLDFQTKTVELYKFNYSKSYKTKTDFTNSIILTEYGTLPNVYYPLNKSYSHFPDHIVISSVRTDLSGGGVTSDSQTINLGINNNKSGFITNLDFLSGNGNVSSSQTITYN
jgi:hypothetical protein